MTLLFITSNFAAAVAFHSAVARYIYVAGREKLLPTSLGVTHPVVCFAADLKAALAAARAEIRSEIGPGIRPGA